MYWNRSKVPATSPLSVEDYTIKVNSAGSEPSVSLVPRAQNRPRVIDFYSWLTSWNYYLQAMSFYHPTRVPELIMYQSIIVRFACQYTFASWYTYDKLFRYHMANHPMMSWSQVADDLFNRYLRGTPRPCGLRRVIMSARLHTLLGMFRSIVNHAP